MALRAPRVKVLSRKLFGRPPSEQPVAPPLRRPERRVSFAFFGREQPRRREVVREPWRRVERLEQAEDVRVRGREQHERSLNEKREL
jgi:hypothetical protein